MSDTADIQARMRARLAQIGIAESPEIPRVEDRSTGPVSSSQRRMLVHQLRVPDSAVYNLCIALAFEGLVDHDALSEAFSKVVHKHEILRTTYHLDEGGVPFQKVHESLSFAPQTAIMTDISAQAFAEEVERRARGNAPIPYNLAADTPIRVQILSTPERTAAILSMHHIAWDGMTFAALSRDLEHFYREALSQDVGHGDALTVQNLDHAIWEKSWMESTDHTAARQHWIDTLVPLPEPLALPVKQTKAPGLDADRRDRTLSQSAHQRLRILAAQARTTPFAIMLSGYYLSLQRLSGQDDIIVGTAVANRNHAGLDALIGNFGNTLPLRISARPGQTFATLIDAVAGTVARALSHQGYPFDLITNDLAPHNHREDRGLIDAMMVFLTQDIEGPQLPGSTTSWHLYSGGQAEFPLSAEVFALPHRLDVKVTYQTGIFEAETIDRIIDGVEEILETAELTDALAALVGLKGESREGARGPEYPSTGATLDSLMRSQTRTSPEAYAVIGDGENAFTYAQLDARANALALLLADSGVGVGDRVGVILPRTSELVVALAGIVRSGAAYVPMMPDYPTERIR